MENDIRIERTKNALRGAFVELLDETPIYGISVTNLTKRAKVSRVTFYIHYTDMADFVDKTCDSVLSNITWGPSKELNLFVFENAKLVIRKQVEAVRENADIFRALLGSNGPDQFYGNMIDMIFKEYLFHLKKYKDRFEDVDEMNAIVKYVTAGEIQLVTDWITKDPIVPNEVMVDRIVNLTFRGIFKSLDMMEDGIAI